MKKEIQAKLKRQKVLITCLSLGGALLTGAAATMTTLYCLNNFSSSKFEEVVQYDFATDETSRFSFTIPIEMRRYEHLYISCEKFNNDGTNFVICYYDQKAGTTGPFRTIVGTTFDWTSSYSVSNFKKGVIYNIDEILTKLRENNLIFFSLGGTFINFLSFRFTAYNR